MGKGKRLIWPFSFLFLHMFYNMYTALIQVYVYNL